MHRVFGSKENTPYTHREGAYLIPFHNNRVGVIQTAKGYFFIGGGLEDGEDDLSCIKRECLEETGYLPVVNRQLCSAEAFIKHPAIGYFHPIQTYYVGKLSDRVCNPVETDHILCWVEYDLLRGRMSVEMQNWALEQYFSLVKNS